MAVMGVLEFAQQQLNHLPRVAHLLRAFSSARICLLHGRPKVDGLDVEDAALSR